jgi:transposase
MKEKRRQYDRAFKLSAVRLLESSEKPLVQVARGLGISGSMLRRWREQVKARGSESYLEGGGLKRTELEHLRRENRELRRENEILKKTLGFEARARRRGTGP